MNTVPQGGGVYLLHFNKPLGNPANPRGQARHYIGFTESYRIRMESHRQGGGARIMAAVMQAGLDFTVARVWPGRGRNFERRLKNRHGAKALCPVCKGGGT